MLFCTLITEYMKETEGF